MKQQTTFDSASWKHDGCDDDRFAAIEEKPAAALDAESQQTPGE